VRQVCVIGKAAAGKSTLIGVLTSGMLDDGKVRTRAAALRPPARRE
jgi:GTPase